MKHALSLTLAAVLALSGCGTASVMITSSADDVVDCAPLSLITARTAVGEADRYADLDRVLASKLRAHAERLGADRVLVLETIVTENGHASSEAMLFVCH